MAANIECVHQSQGTRDSNNDPSQAFHFCSYQNLADTSRFPRAHFGTPMSSPSLQPSLAPPGAGLPLPELWIARFLFKLGRLAYSHDGATQRFLGERAAIRSLLNSASASQCGVPVLIPRLKGLEDSSRFWSVWMTLEHLRITNTVFASVIQTLSSGKLPEFEARTEAVKPSPATGAESVASYEASCDAILDVLHLHSELRHTQRFPHPWFGPMTAADWHLLAGGHMAIHRRQIEAILRGLPPNESPKARA
jgi:uncharacterized damage-inducible protein DinB